MRKTKFDLLALLTASLAVSGPALAQQSAEFCSSGFVLGDTDEDALLSPDEIGTMRAAEFGALDQNADGSVTLDEIRACREEAAGLDILPRNVSPTGSGDLGGSGVQVVLEGLEDGSLDRTEYMVEAERALDATGNEEDNQLEWARAFIVLLPGEDEIDVRTIPREEYAARAAVLFDRLDADADGALTPEEWTGDATADLAAGADAVLERLDRDGSGDISEAEYTEAGTERARLAREAALAAGWEDKGDHAAGIGTEEEPGDVVSTSSEGLVTEGEDTAGAAGAAPAGAEETAQAGTAPSAATGEETAPPQDRVPVFYYLFLQGS